MKSELELARELPRLITPFAVGTLLYIAAVYGAVRTFPQTWFFEAGPGRNPPWYFIGQAAIEGVWAMVGFILLSLFTAIGAGRLGPTVWAAFAVSGVSFLSRIGPGIDVWFKTSRLWSPALARSSWVSFDDYIRSYEIAANWSLGASIVLGLASLAMYVRGLKAEKEASARA